MSSDSLKNFSESLKRVRIASKIPVVDLAAAVGVTKGSIYAYEAGKWYPPGEVLAKLSSILNHDFSAEVLVGHEPALPYHTTPAATSPATGTATATGAITLRAGVEFEVSVPVFGPADRDAAMAIAAAALRSMRGAASTAAEDAADGIVSDTAAETAKGPAVSAGPPP